jgi:PIN domain nuclease of toxin-antitoxin system
MPVFDTSALLAYVLNEEGAAAIRARILDGGQCSAANWSELAQKIHQAGHQWENVRTLLTQLGLQVESVTAIDAEFAATLWQRKGSLSLGDRLCLALGARLNATVVTCDRAWEGMSGVELVR